MIQGARRVGKSTIAEQFAVNEYRSYIKIDFANTSKEIIDSFDDFKKIDASGSVSAMYRSIPSQLSRDVRRYSITTALSRRTTKEDEYLFDLVDSKTVLICNNTTDPRVSLSLTKDMDCYKLYLADTGLFVTLLFADRPVVENDLYAKLMADKLPANLGYLYENAVAQMIAATDRELYYHTWNKKDSTHYYETDFLYAKGEKVIPVEVKSSGVGKHESITEFCKKFKKNVASSYMLSQKDIGESNGLQNYPIYLLPALLEK